MNTASKWYYSHLNVKLQHVANEFQPKQQTRGAVHKPVYKALSLIDRHMGFSDQTAAENLKADVERQARERNIQLPLRFDTIILNALMHDTPRTLYAKHDDFRLMLLYLTSSEQKEALLQSICKRLVIEFQLLPTLLYIVNQLLEDPRVDPSANNNYAIRLASEHGHIAVVNRLLEDPRVDPSAYFNYAIQWASELGHGAVVNRLLEDPRVDPSANSNYAIGLASEHGHSAIVNRLLEDPRVDPSAYDNYAIRWASKHGHSAVVNRLLEDPRVDPSAYDNQAIRLASEHGHSAIVNRLMKDHRVQNAMRN